MSIHALVATILVASASAAAAPAHRRCQIDSVPAECFYDAAGDVAYWVIHYETDVPRSGTPATKRRQESFKRWREQFAEWEDHVCQVWSDRQRTIDYRKTPGSAPTPNLTTPFLPAYPEPRFYLRCRIFATQFEPWSIGVLNDFAPFPSKEIETLGILDMLAIRAPLYMAGGALLSHWSDFWTDCRTAAPADRYFSGCETPFKDYTRGSAVTLATSKSYPNGLLAARAETIARALDKAMEFHVASSELKSLRRAWADPERVPLEPDELPSVTMERLQTLEKELAAALKDVETLGAYR